MEKEIETFELKELKKYLKNKKIYMFLGNSKKEQYSSLTELNNVIKSVSKKLEKNACVFYFGELPDQENIDIGYVIQELSIRRPDLEIILINHTEIEHYPNFVSKLFNLNIKTTKKRGLNSNTNKPLGTTKFWFDINKTNKIDKIYILGGDYVVLEEYKLSKELEIDTEYFPIKRKFNDDGKTIIKKNAPIPDKVGPTYEISELTITK
tara:strand:- start:48969 stop:49592 length:624 start_codon:yes stop_codon:yes gene_type:complete